MTTKKNDLERYKQAKRLAKLVRTYRRCRDDSRYDKLGLGFGLDATYAISDVMTLRLDGRSGVYGSSSCGRLTPDVGDFGWMLRDYLNAHIEEILHGAAMHAIREYRSAALAEAERLRQMAAALEAEVGDDEALDD